MSVNVSLLYEWLDTAEYVGLKIESGEMIPNNKDQ